MFIAALWGMVKAPWTFAVVMMTTAVAVYLLVNSELAVPHAAYQFSAILVGGFITKSLIAVGVGAMRTMLLMVYCALLLIVTNVTFTDAEVFKDSAVQAMLAFAGGGIVVLIGALLERQKEKGESNG